MKYTEKRFSVASPGTQQYADNWEATFRKPGPCNHCGGVIGPAIGGGLMCYGCGPGDLKPFPHARDCNLYWVSDACGCLPDTEAK